MTTFTHNGNQYRMTIEQDEFTTGAPWGEDAGHGPVRSVRRHTWMVRTSKSPGERILHNDGRTLWLYDWQAACKLARKDGWNAAPYDAPNRIERAVQADFDRMRGFLSGDWTWCGVVVQQLDDEGEPVGDTDALWSIESDAGDYLMEVAHELADQLPLALGAEELTRL